MKTQEIDHHIIKEGTQAAQDTYDNNLGIVINQFIVDKKGEQLSPNTIRSYRLLLAHFLEYCESQSIQTINQITYHVLNEYVSYLDSKGHNRGGCQAYLRPVRAMFHWLWYVNENLDQWKNPFAKFRMPKKEEKILEPIKEEEIQALLNTCDRDDFIDSRDRAIILALASTGIRGSELCAIEIATIDHLKMMILITTSKGNKFRHVFFDRATKLAINRYLRNHAKSERWLFTNRLGEKLTFHALRQMLQARGKLAGIGKVKVHSFRRYYTHKALNSGVDPLSLAYLLGHKDVGLLMKYAKQTPDNLQAQYLKIVNRDK